ncbi:MAG: pantoate--beta-alanine ligase [Bacteroidales bacterium]|nr:pantoate--beta-alanine ligase [Bacteroidales bacterium]
MKTITTVSELQKEICAAKAEGKTVGLVPTMGALHNGHISLVKRCVGENDVAVVSVFVNPTQFNDPNDLRNYPRNLDADVELLRQNDCSIVFAPSVEEMYPEPDTRTFDFGMLDKVMEGAFRPGHFNGVAQIVSKLFDIVKPHRAYFGEKDFQQLAIIREMVRQFSIPVEIVGCPIVRETDRLAMSSRNARLTPEQREIAPFIAQTLNNSLTFVPSKKVSEVIEWVTGKVNALPELRVEYFQIVDGNTLQPVTCWDETEYIVGCITVFCGDVRLIDNIRYK